MKKVSLPPYAPALIESIRSIGYTIESAIADLVDNSVSALAAHIQIRFSPYDQPYIAVLDDGSGMNPDELTKAMQHGSTNPLLERSPHDLGRFGLGLKTASLSQCRRLTVVSKKDGILSGRCWDLDVIIDEEDFVLLELEAQDIEEMPLISELKTLKTGTLVVWHDLDKLLEGESSVEKALNDSLDRVRTHLELVFHRYLSGEPGLKKVQMSINGLDIQPNDPFLSKNMATTPRPEQSVKVENSSIQIKPYILPHPNKLSQTELSTIGGVDGLRKSQGFYVYRNRRLITWGTWFRLVRQEELSKLARVRVDIPNDLDYLWTLDIKKSSAYPPEVVRQALRQVVENIADWSKRVHVFRGRRTKHDDLVHLWDRIQGREGVSYKINLEHPSVSSLVDELDAPNQKSLRNLLTMLESSFPIHAAYADIAQDRKVQQEMKEDAKYIRDLAEDLLKVAGRVPGARERLLSNLHLVEPFSSYPNLTREIVEGLTHGIS